MVGVVTSVAVVETRDLDTPELLEISLVEGFAEIEESFEEIDPGGGPLDHAAFLAFAMGSGGIEPESDVATIDFGATTEPVGGPFDHARIGATTFLRLCYKKMNHVLPLLLYNTAKINLSQKC